WGCALNKCEGRNSSESDPTPASAHFVRLADPLRSGEGSRKSVRVRSAGVPLQPHRHPALVKLLALEPAFAGLVERGDHGAVDARHVRLHLVAGLALQIGEMAIAFREAHQQLLVELRYLRDIDGVEAVALVDRLA